MPEVFRYLNYHQYLADFYKDKKESSGFFSYRYMGKKLGLDPGFLVKVLQGKLPLSVKSIKNVIRFCGLTENEGEYFELLVKYGRAKSVKEIKTYFEKIMELRDSKSRLVEGEQYTFYQKWYHTAIRCLLSYQSFKGDYKKLASSLSPAITAKEARDSVKLLEDLGFITKEKNGEYKVKDAVLTTGEKWRSAAVHSYQEESIRMGLESLDRHPKEKRDISTITVAIPGEYLEEIKERAKEFRRSILQMDIGDDVPDSVYQVNVQVIPLTKNGEKKQ